MNFLAKYVHLIIFTSTATTTAAPIEETQTTSVIPASGSLFPGSEVTGSGSPVASPGSETPGSESSTPSGSTPSGSTPSGWLLHHFSFVSLLASLTSVIN